MKGPLRALRDGSAGLHRAALGLVKSARLLPAAVLDHFDEAGIRQGFGDHHLRIAGVKLALEMTAKGDPIPAKVAKDAGLIDRLAGEGLAILLISSDHEEIERLSHRVLVMNHGYPGGLLEGAEITINAIARLSFGVGANLDAAQ